MYGRINGDSITRQSVLALIEKLQQPEIHENNSKKKENCVTSDDEKADQRNEVNLTSELY